MNFSELIVDALSIDIFRQSVFFFGNSRIPWDILLCIIFVCIEFMPVDDFFGRIVSRLIDIAACTHDILNKKRSEYKHNYF